MAFSLCVTAPLVLGLPREPTAAAGAGEVVAASVAAAGCAALASGMLTTTVAVDPHQLSFQMALGDFPPPAQAIAVRCVDVTDYPEDCGGTVSVNQPWLQIDHGDFYGVDQIEVWVDPLDLEPGVYEGKIHVSYDFISVDDEEDVEVELIIDEPPPSS